jgi:hypothetical protein
MVPEDNRSPREKRDSCSQRNQTDDLNPEAGPNWHWKEQVDGSTSYEATDEY